MVLYAAIRAGSSGEGGVNVRHWSCRWQQLLAIYVATCSKTFRDKTL